MTPTKPYTLRANTIRKITEQYYEPGRQDRCLKYVWKKQILPLLGISYRTYLRYINFLQTSEGYNPKSASDPLDP